jgi:hypothetical protein
MQLGLTTRSVKADATHSSFTYWLEERTDVAENRIISGFVIGLLLTVSGFGESNAVADSQCPAPQAKWNGAERLAWQQVCSTNQIDLTGHPEATEPIRSDFVETISNDGAYTARLGGRLVIKGATFEGPAKVRDLNINLVRLSQCKGSLAFRNLNVSGTVDITDSKFKLLRISSAKVGAFALDDSELDDLSMDGTDVAGHTYFNNTKIKNDLTITSSRFRSDLDFEKITFNSILISQSKVDGSMWLSYSNMGDELQLEDLRVGWAIGMSSAGTGQAQPLAIKQITIGNVTAASISLPRNMPKVDISGLNISDWPNDPEPTITLLKRNSQFDPRLFDQISKSYRDAGNYRSADAVQYLKKNLEFARSNGFATVFLFLSWITVGYGVIPSIGFVWFAALTGIGYVVFRTGESALLDNKIKPRSWFVFSMDTIIPVIKLDADHDKVAFKDWRQYYLYAMRIFSAGLVFLVAKILSDIIAGY